MVPQHPAKSVGMEISLLNVDRWLSLVLSGVDEQVKDAMGMPTSG